MLRHSLIKVAEPSMTLLGRWLAYATLPLCTWSHNETAEGIPRIPNTVIVG